MNDLKARITSTISQLSQQIHVTVNVTMTSVFITLKNNSKRIQFCIFLYEYSAVII